MLWYNACKEEYVYSKGYGCHHVIIGERKMFWRLGLKCKRAPKTVISARKLLAPKMAQRTARVLLRVGEEKSVVSGRIYGMGAFSLPPRLPHTPSGHGYSRHSPRHPPQACYQARSYSMSPPLQGSFQRIGLRALCSTLLSTPSGSYIPLIRTRDY